MSTEARRELKLASGREKFFMHNTLVSIPLMLLGHSILVDMRNETSVAGRLNGVDGLMNISLQEVVLIDQKGLQYEFDDFMITAKNIRQIHLPDTIKVVPELRKFLDNLKPKKQPRVRSTKFQRAQARHQETVAQINQENSDQGSGVKQISKETAI